MAIAYASHAASDIASATSTVIDKPSGLAVGDLMIYFHAIFGNSGGETPSSGFTELGTENDGLVAGEICYGYKYATSGDVAASNFTFSTVNSLDQCGAIIRITTATNLSSILLSCDGFQTNTISPSFTGLTPNSRGNSMLLQGWVSTSNADGIDSYAIATSNPSWTELFEKTNGSSRFSVAYAIRPEVTATGNVSCAGGSGGSEDWVGAMIAVAPAWETTTNETTTLTEAELESIGSLSAETISLTESIDADDGIIWTEQSKNTATWTEQPKS